MAADLMLIGSGPPSHLDSQPSSAASSYNDEPTDNQPRSKYALYADMLFRPQDGARVGTRTYKQTSHVNINIGKYQKRRDQCQEVDNKTNILSAGGIERQPVGRPPSRLPSGNRRAKGHTPSFIDESLFGVKVKGETFSAPWNPETKEISFVLDCTDYRNRTPSTIASRQLRPGSSDGSRPGSTRPMERSNKTRVFRKLIHHPTYVDESLFGPRLDEPDWTAPWENTKLVKAKPLLFDAMDHRLIVEHLNIKPIRATRPPSSLRKVNSTSNLAARPVWR